MTRNAKLHLVPKAIVENDTSHLKVEIEQNDPNEETKE
jgi:hypothetical protein